MTNHHGWLFGQRVCDNSVNLLANFSPSGIEENVTAKALDGSATDPSAVLVKRAQDRLYPFPIERTLRFGISAIFRIYLRVSDATAFAKSFGTFSLENQELVVDLAAPSLDVRGQRNAVIPNEPIKRIAIIWKGYVYCVRERAPKLLRGATKSV
jgi:hypothetical protein